MTRTIRVPTFAPLPAPSPCRPPQLNDVHEGRRCVRGCVRACEMEINRVRDGWRRRRTIPALEIAGARSSLSFSLFFSLLSSPSLSRSTPPSPSPPPSPLSLGCRHSSASAPALVVRACALTGALSGRGWAAAWPLESIVADAAVRAGPGCGALLLRPGGAGRVAPAGLHPGA